MNFRFLLVLAAVGGFLTGTPLLVASSPDNPYTPIVTRNVFGLVPIPVVDPASLVPETPTPKITPNGIMTIFGKVQVLFKVAGVASAGKPAKDESYVLGEGERQDEIEVQKIDEKSATITFNNHGKIETLTLAEGKASGGGPSVGGPGSPPPMPTARPTIPLPGTAPGSMGVGGRAGRGQNAQNGARSGEANPSFGMNPNVNERGIYSPSAEPAGEQLTAEQRMLLIEAQRAQGGPHADLLPPTAITEDVKKLNEGADNSGGGGQ